MTKQAAAIEWVEFLVMSHGRGVSFLRRWNLAVTSCSALIVVVPFRPPLVVWKNGLLTLPFHVIDLILHSRPWIILRMYCIIFGFERSYFSTRTDSIPMHRNNVSFSPLARFLCNGGATDSREPCKSLKVLVRTV